jgi:hypothetical protein
MTAVLAFLRKVPGSTWLALGLAIAVLLALHELEHRAAWNAEAEAELDQRAANAIQRAHNKAALDSLDRLIREAQDSAKRLALRPARLIPQIIREIDTLPAPVTPRDSAADRIIAQQDTVIRDRGAELAQLHAALGQAGQAFVKFRDQRTADSTRIRQLEGTLEHRPGSKLLGFLPRPKCGIGPGFAIGKGSAIGLIAGCVMGL